MRGTSAGACLFVLALSLLPSSANSLTQGDYSYTTNAAGQATIIHFNDYYAGPLSITNTLGGCPVTAIQGNAFSYCRNLTSVNIPSSITNINFGPFSGCSRLTNITCDSANPTYSSADGAVFDKTFREIVEYPCGKTGAYVIPSSVTNIRYSAFNNCVGLTAVLISSSVSSIGWYAFQGCSSLNSLSIPKGVKTIGYFAFSDCSDLLEISIPSTTTAIGQQVLMNCFSLLRVTVDSANTNYADSNGVLFDKQFTTILRYPAGILGHYDLPNTVTTIGWAAFQGCTGLTSISIPNGVTTFFTEAFYGCSSLTSVTIPESVTSIGDSAFSSCTNLTQLFFRGNAPHLAPYSYNGVLFFNSFPTIYHLPGTTDWGASFYGRPTALWLPRALRDDAFGIRNGNFGFTISWAAGRTVVVEATTNLASGVWTPVITNRLNASGSLDFNDSRSSDFTARFYRIVWP